MGTAHTAAMGVLAFTEVTGVSAFTDTGATGVPITGMAMAMALGMGMGMGMGTGMATLTTGLILLTHRTITAPTTPHRRRPRHTTITRTGDPIIEA